VLQRRFTLSYIDTPGFTGHVSLLCLDAVREPLWVELGTRRLCLADAGYSWLQHFPADEPHYVLTTMFDAQGQVIQWYFDICREHGVDARGVPWYDDLYLDVVLAPPEGPLLLDEDELADALQSGDITLAEYDLAWREARQLLHALEQGRAELLALGPEHRRMLLRTC
jgi:predicted RNA-binding protein associated with RNAse of E/G family